jgi:hypothetical protein
VSTKQDSKEENDLTLKEVQIEKDIQLARSCVENGKRACFSSISQQGFVVKSLWNQFNRLCIREGMLVRKWTIIPSCKDIYQAFIPHEERRKVLKMCHDSHALGHLGITKTPAKIR